MKGKKMFKRILAGCITTALCLSLICTNGIVTQARRAPSSTLPMFYGGNGTQENPYQIVSRSGFLQFRDAVNSGRNFKDQYIKLCTDIDLSSVCYAYVDENGTHYIDWVPIGLWERNSYDANAFDGSFDGDGHTVSGLYIKNGGDGTGLFGEIEVNGSLKNLTVEGDVCGKQCVGGVVGKHAGKALEHCSFSGTVKGSEYVGGIVGYAGIGGKENCKVSNCWAWGDISCSGEMVGGIAGVFYKNYVNMCYFSKGTVSGKRDVGGIVGLSNAKKITNCATLGKIRIESRSESLQGNYSGTFSNKYVAGGIAGGNGGLIEDCVVNKDTVIASVGCVGGIAGEAFKCKGEFGHLKNCTNYGTVYSLHNRHVDGIVGETENEKIEVINCANYGEVTINANPTVAFPPKQSGVSVDITIVGDIGNSFKISLVQEGGGTASMNSDSIATTGTEIKLTATPDAGYVFDRWEAEGVTVNNPKTANTTFTMPKNQVNVRAVFVPDTQNNYNDLKLSQEGLGQVTSSLSSNTNADTLGPLNCVRSGTEVQLTATPADGYEFEKWESSDVASINNPTNAIATFTMPAKSVAVKAIFKKSANVHDVIVDSCGVLLPQIIIRIICYIGRKTVFSWLVLDDK